jgi:hypothetical protein
MRVETKMSVSSDIKLKMCRKTVTAAGTPEALVAGSRDVWLCKAIRIRAYMTNTGNIYIGGDNQVSATDYSDILAPGEVWTAKVEDLGKFCYINMTQIWLDADVSGDGISYTALVESEPY